MERVQKIIAKAGITSRRHAEVLIKCGKVLINGKVAILGDKALATDKIIVDDVVLGMAEKKVYYLLHKPPQVITSARDPQGRKVVTDLIKESKRIFPVGRLDYNTTGVLLLTNDGNLAYKLTHPSYEVIRIYQAQISRSLSSKELHFLNGDQVVVNHKISKQKVIPVAPTVYKIILHLGTYHHIKKLFHLVNAPVKSLVRLEFAGLSHAGIPLGEYRKLTNQEISHLKRLTESTCYQNGIKMESADNSPKNKLAK